MDNVASNAPEELGEKLIEMVSLLPALIIKELFDTVYSLLDIVMLLTLRSETPVLEIARIENSARPGIQRPRFDILS